MSRPDWYPNWAGKTIVIVASGPSAPFVDLDKGIGKAKFVAINRSLNLCPWADIWYCCDFQWWHQYYTNKEFRAEVGEFYGSLKVCVDYRIRDQPKWGVKFLYCEKPNDSMVMDLGKVGWGGNSGFNCLNMVVQFKPAKVILVGFDMTKTRGAHWHDPHPKGLSNPTTNSIERWRRVTDNAAQSLRKAGIAVINCSEMSVLKNYPKMDFEEALNYDPAENGITIPPFFHSKKPVAPIVTPEKLLEAEAVVRGFIAKNGNRQVPDDAVNYIATRLAARI